VWSRGGRIKAAGAVAGAAAATYKGARCARAARNRGFMMADLVVIAFPSEEKAEEVRQKLLGMQQNYLIELGDAVIAVKHEDGKVKLNQLMNTTAAGAVSGGFWGLLIGLLFMVPVVGAAIGAGAGAISGALTDVGINDNFMKEVAEVLQPGGAALFLLIRKMTTDKVLEDLQGVGGTVLRTSFDHTKEQALRDALAAHHAAIGGGETAPPATA